MTKENIKSSHIGPKMKICIVITWCHLLFLTWIMLNTKMHLSIQIASFITTIIVIYCQLLLMQDYFYLKSHKRMVDLKKDIKLLEPLLPERYKNDR